MEVSLGISTTRCGALSPPTVGSTADVPARVDAGNGEGAVATREPHYQAAGCAVLVRKEARALFSKRAGSRRWKKQQDAVQQLV